jgi:lysophospholipase L1-like esterase
MAVYDPEDQNVDLSSLSPSERLELGQKYGTKADRKEDEQIEQGTDPDSLPRGGMGRKMRSDADGRDENERSSLQDALGDKVSNNLFNPGPSSGGRFTGSIKSALGKASNKRGLMIGVGGGMVGIIITLASLIGNFQLFQTDHLLKNIESRSRARLNASLDARNDYLVRSYIKLRMMDPDSDTTGTKSLYFKGSRVDTNNPIRDWYETMRASKFEQDLLAKDGIHFTAILDENGRIKPGKLTIKDDPIPLDITKKYSHLEGVDLYTADGATLNDFLNKVDAGDMHYFISEEAFGTQKAGRKAIKQAVNDNTQWHQVFARRQIRKDLMNESGIRQWTLFEETRSKTAQSIQDSKDNLYNKMIDRYYGNNPGTNNMLKCLFANGNCSSNRDPVSPDNTTGSVTSGEALDPNDESTVGDTTSKDSNGKVTTNNLGAGEQNVGTAVSDGIHEAIDTSAADLSKGVSKDAEKHLAQAGPAKKITYLIIAKVTGQELNDVLENAIPNPAKIWIWAKTITKIDSLFTGGKTSKISKMVASAKQAQMVGLFGTYEIANSQLHSGKLTSQEASAFFQTMNSFGNSEGWQAVSGNFAGGSAAAAASDNLSKQDYCKQDPSKRTADQFAWACDSDKPNGASNAATLSEAYSSTLGPIISPIAQSVKAIEGTFVGKALDIFNTFVGDVINKIAGPAIDSIMKETGLDKTISAVMGSAMQKLLVLAGAGPMFDGSQSGNVTTNMLVIGGTASAEDTTRASGGITSNPQSLAYTTKLADQYQAQQDANQSVYTRYASLDNPNSLSSVALMSFHPSTSVRGWLNSIGGIFTSFPKYLGDILTGRSFVHADTDAGQLATWAGVQKYDIPQACIDLDPLDANYLSMATNADTVTGDTSLSGASLGYSTLRDEGAFWQAVYAKIGPDSEATAGKIYDCALLDARVEDSLGAIYGYNNGTGLDDSSSSNQSNSPVASNNKLFILGDSYTDGMQNSGIEGKLQTQGWITTIDAACGRPLHGTGTFTRTCDAAALNGQITHDGLGEVDQPDAQAAIRASGAVVIGLGTNDAGQSAETYAADVTSMIGKVKALNPSVKIYWINLYNTQDGAKLAQFNNKLTSLSASQGFTIIDWSSQAQSHYSANSVHPDVGDGYGALVNIVVSGLGKAPSS